MKILFTLVMVIVFTIGSLSQVPEKMSYQAVIRNASGELVKSNPIGMKISILQGSATGTPVYVETQTPNTNSNGLVTLEIGGGTIVTGTFAGVNWSSGVYYLKTETDPIGGTSYTITGTSQLMSVPYALYSKNAADKAYVDALEKKIESLSGKIMFLAKESNSYPISDSTGIVADFEGNSYKYIKIGTQIWMAENLRTSKYNDGSPILNITDNDEWTNLAVANGKLYEISGAFCWYNNDSATYEKDYGKLYNFGTVKTGKLCPVGWHVPTLTEWWIVAPRNYINNWVGLNLMESGTTHWLNFEGTNETGFTALPGGQRYYDGTFHDIGLSSRYFTSNYAGIYEPLGAYYQLIPYDDGYGLRPTQTMEMITAGLSIRCLKDQSLHSITTKEVSHISRNAATSGGNISNDQLATITARGVCWSTTANPSIADGKTANGTGSGTFTSSITGLTLNTTYYVRAYAYNILGTSYGNELTFRTYADSVTDINGNVYNTVKIGTQVWMAENLKTTKYRNGDLIGTTTPATLDIENETTPKYQWPYDGNENNVATYGRLYTWYAVNDSRNVCPTGWHLPTDTEWTTLTIYLGGESVAGGKLKETGTTHWQNPNTGATDEMRFTALPGGYRSPAGTFVTIGSIGYWWSSTEIDTNYAWSLNMHYSVSDMHRIDYMYKRHSFSVRCLKD